jgi:hypothetical protein
MLSRHAKHPQLDQHDDQDRVGPGPGGLSEGRFRTDRAVPWSAASPENTCTMRGRRWYRPPPDVVGSRPVHQHEGPAFPATPAGDGRALFGGDVLLQHNFLLPYALGTWRVVYCHGHGATDERRHARPTQTKSRQTPLPPLAQVDNTQGSSR